MANQVTNRSINIFIESGQAQKALDLLIKKETALKNELAAATNPKQIAQLGREIDKLKEPIDRASRKLKGELTPSIKDVQKAVNDLGNRLKRMSAEDADFSNVVRQYGEARLHLQQLKAGTDQLAAAQRRIGKDSFFGSFFGNLAAGGITAIISKVRELFSGAFNEALEAEEKTARLKATLDNLGRTDAFDRMISKANEMATRFRFLDNDEVVGVFERLINFGKLTEKQMNDLLPVIIDFSAKQRISLEEGTSVIVKALEGQGKALKEYGINMKDAKTETERMELITVTLAEKVKGAGDTFQNTAAGGIASARQEFKNLQEEIGTGLIPTLNKLLSLTLKAINNLKTFGNAIAAEFRGNNGFIQIALDEVENNPELKQAVIDQADETIRSVMAAQKQIEDQLGRKLNLQNEEDKKLLLDNQNKRISGIEEALKSDNERLGQLMKSMGRDGQLEARSVKIAILARTDALTKLKEALNPNKNVIGVPPPAATDTKAAEAARKKAAEEYKKLADDLEKIRKGIFLSTLNAFDKELAEIDFKYAELQVRAKDHNDLLLQINAFHQREQILLVQRFARQEVAEWDKAHDAINKKADETFRKNLENLKNIRKRIEEDLRNNADTAIDRKDRDRLAAAELAVLRSNGLKKLKAEKELLDEQKRQELANKDLTENEKKVIEEKYRRAKLEAELNEILGWATQVANIFTQIGQIQTDKENAELNRDRKVNDKKKANLESRLKKGIIGQQQYDRELQNIEKAQEKREREVARKQFERTKRENILKAVMNTAEGVTEALPNFILAAAVGAFGLLQIATIAKQKPPEYGHGGLLNGPSHSDQSRGLPVTNPYTGKVQAYLEGGEGIGSKRTMNDQRKYDISGTPSQIYSLLNGINGGVQWKTGATLRPAWSTQRPPQINVAAVNASLGAVKRFYAGGGVFDNSQPIKENEHAPAGNSPEMMALMREMINANMVMAQTIDRIQKEGFRGKVLLSDIQDAEEREENIINEATMR